MEDNAPWFEIAELYLRVSALENSPNHQSDADQNEQEAHEGPYWSLEYGGAVVLPCPDSCRE